MFGAVAELRAVAAFLAMYSDIPFGLSLVLMLGGLAVLAWSSEVFVDGAAAVAKALGISPFIIGMVIGSNLFNTLAVVGLATVISPLVPGPNGEPAF